MFGVDDVLRALEDDGLTHYSDEHGRYRIWDPEREHETMLFMTSASIIEFISGFSDADAVLLFPGISPEMGAFRVLLANIFEGVAIESAEVVVSDGAVKFAR